MTNTCACGSVTVTVKHKPDFIYDCDCTLCRKSGAAWGYYGPDDMLADGEVISYARKDKLEPIVEIHSCKTCGATTHFTLTEAYKAKHPGRDQVGVNMRLFDPQQLEGVEVQYPHGSAWSGTGPFGFRKPAITISGQEPW
ncbi:MAG: aldehyde-activating protein [Pseudomonadota bacterium]